MCVNRKQMPPLFHLCHKLKFRDGQTRANLKANLTLSLLRQSGGSNMNNKSIACSQCSANICLSGVIILSKNSS